MKGTVNTTMERGSNRGKRGDATKGSSGAERLGRNSGQSSGDSIENKLLNGHDTPEDIKSLAENLKKIKADASDFLNSASIEDIKKRFAAVNKRNSEITNFSNLIGPTRDIKLDELDAYKKEIKDFLSRKGILE